MLRERYRYRRSTSATTKCSGCVDDDAPVARDPPRAAAGGVWGEDEAGEGGDDTGGLSAGVDTSSALSSAFVRERCSMTTLWSLARSNRSLTRFASSCTHTHTNAMSRVLWRDARMVRDAHRAWAGRRAASGRLDRRRQWLCRSGSGRQSGASHRRRPPSTRTCSCWAGACAAARVSTRDVGSRRRAAPSPCTQARSPSCMTVGRARARCKDVVVVADGQHDKITGSGTVSTPVSRKERPCESLVAKRAVPPSISQK